MDLFSIDNNETSQITIYTDGGCHGNPGAGGWGAVLLDGMNEIELSGGENMTTNNRMELRAGIEALRALPDGATVDFYTDSQYMKNAFTKYWLRNWKRNGWKTANKNPVLNQDLWMALDELISTRAVKFNWVKGHAGNFFNERCDVLARSTAEKFQRGQLKTPPPIKISEPQKNSTPKKFSTSCRQTAAQ